MTITFYYLMCPVCHKTFAVNHATKYESSDTTVYSCNECGETLPKSMFKAMGTRNNNMHDQVIIYEYHPRKSSNYRYNKKKRLK